MSAAPSPSESSQGHSLAARRGFLGIGPSWLLSSLFSGANPPPSRWGQLPLPRPGLGGTTNPTPAVLRPVGTVRSPPIGGPHLGLLVSSVLPLTPGTSPSLREPRGGTWQLRLRLLRLVYGHSGNPQEPAPGRTWSSIPCVYGASGSPW